MNLVDKFKISMAKYLLLLSSIDKHDPHASPDNVHCFVQIPCLQTPFSVLRVQRVLDASVYAKCRSSHFCWVH